MGGVSLRYRSWVCLSKMAWEYWRKQDGAGSGVTEEDGVPEGIVRVVGAGVQTYELRCPTMT